MAFSARHFAWPVWHTFLAVTPITSAARDIAAPFMIRFVVVFTTLSFLVSLLSWSRAVGLPHFPMAGPALAIHMIIHGLYGGIAALPTRRRGTMAAMALSAMLIDVDHLAYMLGWPVPSRTSHSLFFIVLAPVAMAALARIGLLGRETSPRLAGGMALSVVLAHLAWDSLTSGEARVPFWLPFSTAPLPLPPSVGGLFEIAAVAVMWWASGSRQPRVTGEPAMVAPQSIDRIPPR